VATSAPFVLTDAQRTELTEIAQSRSLPAGYVFRAKLILMLGEGLSFNKIKQRLQTTAPTIIRWKVRFVAQGTDGLDTFHPGQRPTVLTPALRAKILAATRKKPADGSTHWSCRKLAASLGVSKDAVHRVWKEAGIKPHRIERDMASNDPHFEVKAATSLACTSTRRNMPPSSASTKRPPFKLWTGSIRCCPCRRAAPSATASNTTVTVRSHCMPLWTPRQAR
jgi:transposase